MPGVIKLNVLVADSWHSTQHAQHNPLPSNRRAEWDLNRRNTADPLLCNLLSPWDGCVWFGPGVTPTCSPTNAPWIHPLLVGFTSSLSARGCSPGVGRVWERRLVELGGVNITTAYINGIPGTGVKRSWSICKHPEEEEIHGGLQSNVATFEKLLKSPCSTVINHRVWNLCLHSSSQPSVCRPSFLWISGKNKACTCAWSYKFHWVLDRYHYRSAMNTNWVAHPRSAATSAFQ